MTNKFLHISSLVLLLFILLVGANAQGVSETKSQPTIAVLGTISELSDLCALVEAGLFQKGINLVERAKIDSILKEQKLTASGLVDRDNLIKLGQLLRADGFLLISIEEEQKEIKDKPQEKALPILRIRLIDTAYGLRFLDTFEEWDSTKLKETAERITENVSAIAPKLILPPDKAIPIGIVGIHRVELDERYQWLTRALPTMLSARLNKEPRIIMLEREDLKMLLDEKLLTQGKDTAFWGSAILIDGYLQREDKEGIKLQGDKEEVKLQLQIKDFAGKERAVFTELVNPDKPLTAVDKVVLNIIKGLLNAPSITVWEPEKEAEEFFRQGELLRKNRRNKDAIAPLETAYALQPDNVSYTGALFENEWDTRFTDEWEMKWGSYAKRVATGISYYSDLELAYVVSRLIRQIKAGYESGAILANEAFKWQELIGKGYTSSNRNQRYLVNSVSTSTQEVRDINRENRRIWVELVREIIKANPNDWRSNRISIDITCISSDVPDELINNMKKILMELIMPPEDGGKIQSFDERFRLCEYAIGSGLFYNMSHIKDMGKFNKMWEEYLKELSEVKDPLVRFYGYMTLSNDIARSGSKEAKDYCLKAIDILLNELKSPNEPFENEHLNSPKFNIRNDMRLCISFAGFTPIEEISIYEKLYYSLIENNDCENLSDWWGFWHGSPYLNCKDPEIAKRYIKLLEGIAEVMKNCKEDREALERWSNITDWIADTRKTFPQLELEKTPSNFSFPVNMLLNKENWPKKNISYDYSKALLQNNMLWVTFAESYEKPIIGLAGVDLEKKNLISLWQVDFDRDIKEWKKLCLPVVDFSMPLSGAITGIAINEHTSYIAMREIGLVELPGGSVRGVKLFENPKILTEKDGLPSISIMGMVGDGDKLWIAYGGFGKESGLGIYTPKTKHWETVLCSTVKGDTPFNMGNPYAISNLTFSPKRDKLFFIVGEVVDSRCLGCFDEWTHLWGLWKINIETRKVEFIWDREQDCGYYPDVKYIIDSGYKWWLKIRECLIEFDPDLEKGKIIVGGYYGEMLLRGKKPVPQLEIDSSFSRKKIPIELGSLTVHNDRCWERLGNNQIISIHKDDKGHEDTKIFNNDILNGDAVREFFSTPYGLIAIGNGVVGLIETENIDTKNE
ncbi:MAG: CsgG/HfaB family protein [Candidatus Omnitrophica bacterium]|nr:CsgG/HfaB family protein [Candidatus Omnitrophota bacterium]MBU1048092.1 CsgG/HfaB family protein [Candidatus Omnitrophota bacterium]MBU1631419.1 CsgG/HfaB family protein [Candidatus Omnitrophota bacterium]MBU1766645.1 CsgG/HfaB family protein [Candidatus Omnitrophota bacterium]MBU1889462.1 CsgG/HfaB family protein [Candidatus Omnitrophota bacterium]